MVNKIKFQPSENRYFKFLHHDGVGELSTGKWGEVVLGVHSKSAAADKISISNECRSYRQLEGQVDMMIQELESIKKFGRKFFGK